MAEDDPWPEFDNLLWSASTSGQLMARLHTLPRASWSDPTHDCGSLLHYAGYGDNAAAAAALLGHGLDGSARDKWMRTPGHVAAANAQPRVMEVLCAAGADVRALNQVGQAPLDCALVANGGSTVVEVLVANGVRLRSAAPEYHSLIAPALWAMERGVLRCRSVVVTLLGLKRRRGPFLRPIDRWVVRQLGVEVWTTRVNRAWAVH